jgi:hypothetical protein
MWLMFALVMRTVLAPSLVTEKARSTFSDDAKGANSKQVINDVKVRIAEKKNHYQTELYKWIPRT